MGVLVKIGFAQLNATVGDFAGNGAAIAAAYGALVEQGAEIVLTPELALCGYPPLDLLFKTRFVPEGLEALERLAPMVGGVPLVVGLVTRNASGAGRPFRNAAAIVERGRVREFVFKTLLPTYDVFNEARYFEPSTTQAPVAMAGRRVGVTICEDIWTPEHLPGLLYRDTPLETLAAAGAELVVNISASPFELGKHSDRRQMLAGLAARHRVPIAYCNAIGGNDQLVFDGNSLLAGASGVVWNAPAFREHLETVPLAAAPPASGVPRSDIEDLHDALVLGVRDYLRKCGFRSCLLGLSGGIDSAVTACLAVVAVGSENVTGVLLPSPFSSDHSITDAEALSANLGIRQLTLPIHGPLEAVRAQLEPVFAGLPEDATEENLQARLRGLALMALSNKTGSLLLTTGNKSELAVGYCTLYGDMCGGLAAISDVPKTLVYALAHFINSKGREIIPASTIAKAPSAELRPGQTDQDTLPPYDILDSILRLYIEDHLSAAQIAAHGFDEKTVRWVLRRVDLNEYKRQQAAPGIKVTGKAFGRGRQMPIAQKFIG